MTFLLWAVLMIWIMAVFFKVPEIEDFKMKLAILHQIDTNTDSPVLLSDTLTNTSYVCITANDFMVDLIKKEAIKGNYRTKQSNQRTGDNKDKPLQLLKIKN